jgi:hypothetical protein
LLRFIARHDRQSNGLSNQECDGKNISLGERSTAFAVQFPVNSQVSLIAPTPGTSLSTRLHFPHANRPFAMCNKTCNMLGRRCSIGRAECRSGASADFAIRNKKELRYLSLISQAQAKSKPRPSHFTFSVPYPGCDLLMMCNRLIFSFSLQGSLFCYILQTLLEALLTLVLSMGGWGFFLRLTHTHLL